MESERLELYKSLVSEITKGMEQVKQLQLSCSNKGQEKQDQAGVLERMLSSHQEALLILTASSTSLPESKDATTSLLTSKTMTDSVKIEVSAASSELPPDDGYSWRKYGQKRVLGCKYPRSYYRCGRGTTCRAGKHVQRSDDGTIFKVVYRGEHVCQTEP